MVAAVHPELQEQASSRRLGAGKGELDEWTGRLFGRLADPGPRFSERCLEAGSTSDAEGDREEDPLRRRLQGRALNGSWAGHVSDLGVG